MTQFARAACVPPYTVHTGALPVSTVQSGWSFRTQSRTGTFARQTRCGSFCARCELGPVGSARSVSMQPRCGAFDSDAVVSRFGSSAGTQGPALMSGNRYGSFAHGAPDTARVCSEPDTALVFAASLIRKELFRSERATARSHSVQDAARSHSVQDAARSHSVQDAARSHSERDTARFESDACTARLHSEPDTVYFASSLIRRVIAASPIGVSCYPERARYAGRVVVVVDVCGSRHFTRRV